jgi:hypothetical protein
MTTHHRSKRNHLYRLWIGMKERCNNPNSPSFSRYGGRGIVVCCEWENDYPAFERWICMQPGVGSRNLEIDRRDNNGPYSPDNCRLATKSVNNRNRKNNRIVIAFGETKCLAEWVDDHRCKVSWPALARRIDRGWPTEEAITSEKRNYL